MRLGQQDASPPRLTTFPSSYPWPSYPRPRTRGADASGTVSAPPELPVPCLPLTSPAPGGHRRQDTPQLRWCCLLDGVSGKLSSVRPHDHQGRVGVNMMNPVASVGGRVVATVTDIGTLIVRTPEVRGGRPRIAGTGVTVRRIVGWYQLGLTPADIIAEFGHLNLAQVYAALAYYHANREEIEADLAAEETEAEQLERAHANPARGDV